MNLRDGIRRLAGRLGLAPATLPRPESANINGPSRIPVPSWVEAPPGRYYRCFAHHKGTCIRLACGD